jgi:hypothetical protein
MANDTRRRHYLERFRQQYAQRADFDFVAERVAAVAITGLATDGADMYLVENLNPGNILRWAAAR